MSQSHQASSSEGISEALSSQAKWNNATPAIQDLYLAKNLPAWLVKKIMEVLYDFSASEQVYRKRFPKKSNRNADPILQGSVEKGTREKAKSPRAPRVISEEVKPPEAFRFKLPLRPQPSPRRYRLQEKAIYSIHHFLGAMFTCGSQKSWSANQIGFVGPDGQEPQFDQWSFIESRCDSVSTLLRCNQVVAAQEMFQGLDPGLDVLVKLPDPLFLGKIWRLGLVLHGLDRRAPQLRAVYSILGRLRSVCIRLYGSDSPISAVLDCIVDVDETDFSPTMRLGFRETLAVLDHVVQDENIMMLSLWSTYAQYFSKTFVKVVKRKPANPTPQNAPKSPGRAAKRKASEAPPRERLKDHMQKDVLFLKFDQVWHECYDPRHLAPEKWRESDVCLRISHNYAYAAFWVCEKTWIGMKMAQRIIEDTRPWLKEHPVWSVKAMAFSVACKIISTTYQRSGRNDECEKVLADAIEVLSCGDDQTCHIKAMSICLTLVSRRLRNVLSESGKLPEVLYNQAKGVSGMQERTPEATKDHRPSEPTLQ
ncbi:hypothetical protein NM208_g365 [Fusarium decemcellulare]|uniref:Uncharacterized protein n=1 Tax=Fusarium decemcellulare TaxID=57161 RepID=A0ACC1SZW5_9HYPO|nr:hypothetical protein NM208_g365 [Fusarium decemcellulare]